MKKIGLLAALKDFFELTATQASTEWKKLDADDKAYFTRELEKSGLYQIVKTTSKPEAAKPVAAVEESLAAAA